MEKLRAEHHPGLRRVTMPAGLTLASCLVFAVFMSECIVYTSFQSADVLAPGRVTAGWEIGAGTGVTGYISTERFLVDFGPSVRVGLGSNLDVGLRVSTLAADIKYQFLRGRQAGAFDLGISYFPRTNSGFDSPNYESSIGIYPTLLFSGDHYYYGFRMPIVRLTRFDIPEWYFAPGLVAGLSLGGRFRFVPEIGVFRAISDSGYPGFAVSGGLAFQYTFGR